MADKQEFIARKIAEFKGAKQPVEIPAQPEPAQADAQAEPLPDDNIASSGEESEPEKAEEIKNVLLNVVQLTCD